MLPSGVNALAPPFPRPVEVYSGRRPGFCWHRLWFAETLTPAIGGRVEQVPAMGAENKDRTHISFFHCPCSQGYRAWLQTKTTRHRVNLIYDRSHRIFTSSTPVAIHLLKIGCERRPLLCRVVVNATHLHEVGRSPALRIHLGRPARLRGTRRQSCRCQWRRGP